jgi:hypothetical protein
MNRLEQFLNYVLKVFGLKPQLKAVGDCRPYPQIPTLSVLLCLLVGVVIRAASYSDLAYQTQRRRLRRLCHLKKPISDDTLEYVSERLNLEDLRQALAAAAKTLKKNKAMESCKINGLLFLSLDANEHFASRSRCCPDCSQRQVQDKGPDGQPCKVTEY